jgi:hypothetical protein
MASKCEYRSKFMPIGWRFAVAQLTFTRGSVGHASDEGPSVSGVDVGPPAARQGKARSPRTAVAQIDTSGPRRTVSIGINDGLAKVAQMRPRRAESVAGPGGEELAGALRQLPAAAPASAADATPIASPA